MTDLNMKTTVNPLLSRKVSSLTLPERFQRLEAELNTEVLEREHETHTAALALVSNKHHFTVGPPGLAKSLMVNRLSKRIDDMIYFHWLLTKFTTPDEVYGGPDLKYLKEHGILRRIVEKKLPEAHVAFLDEIFKGSSAILNTLLTAMNERVFHNPGDDENIPLITIFGASNEIPDGEELGAMWDRLHFRHVLAPIGSATNFKRMLQGEFSPDPEKILTLEDITQAQREVHEIYVPEEVLESIIELRYVLRGADILVTDRRWKESITIIQAEAWMRGDSEVNIDDCRPLVHTLWSDDGQRREVMNHVLSMINPMDRVSLELWDSLRSMENDLEKILLEADNDRVKLQKCMESFGKLKIQKKDYLEIKGSGRETEYTIQAINKYVDLVQFLQNKIGLLTPSKS
jgi:MoxR-like ATPase